MSAMPNSNRRTEDEGASSLEFVSTPAAVVHIEPDGRADRLGIGVVGVEDLVVQQPYLRSR